MYFPVLARVNRFVPTVKRGDKQDCMLLRLLIWAYGPYSISCARKANEDCIRVCRCVSVLFLKYGMQYIVFLLLQFFLWRGLSFRLVYT